MKDQPDYKAGLSQVRYDFTLAKITCQVELMACKLTLTPLNLNPQLQSGENYSYLFNLKPNICKIWCLNSDFIVNDIDLIS